MPAPEDAAAHAVLDATFANIRSTVLVLNAAYLESDCDCATHVLPYRRRAARRRLARPVAHYDPETHVGGMADVTFIEDFGASDITTFQTEEQPEEMHEVEFNAALIPGNNAAIYS